MKTKISVVLCTYNNSISLALTLNELSNQEILNDLAIQIIVVDNNSPDDTAKIVAPFLNNRDINFEYVFEGKQGLSHARNTGINRARGDYILFTDDDAAVPHYWISEYAKLIRLHKPDCLYSKITILWEQQRPWWFVDEFTPCFVGLDYGDEILLIQDNTKEFYGKNFCIRKDLLLELGGFDPKLGRNGNSLAAGEETLLYRKMLTRNDKIIYFPTAPVGHRLKKREYGEENIKKLYLDGAYSTYHLANQCARKKLIGRPLGLLIDSLKTLPQCIVGLSKSHFKNDRARRHFHWLRLRRALKLISLWITSP